ncbi:hypothetical protein GW7_04775 [Heterocephalus glaber]|uniref:Uncharacterized protein n=1 Tax=Heterocephalus glaber TaxID=10181 RepID=G5C3E5_HETGA|nr:hypothetical protein GW7_04775 [Heterocephalus glaber]
MSHSSPTAAPADMAWTLLLILITLHTGDRDAEDAKGGPPARPHAGAPRPESSAALLLRAGFFAFSFLSVALGSALCFRGKGEEWRCRGGSEEEPRRLLATPRR